LFSKDYIRLKNIELSYTLPAAITSRVRLGSARVFVNGQNVLTFDKLGVYDPESANGNGQYYPQAKVFNTGVSVSF
jgi:TonB-dependent starch-binding outer membrane protein SusC